jgi:membrane protein DedA with SNARE-associated domain
LSLRDAARWKRPLLVAAIARYTIPIAALPLAAALIPDRVPLLTLLRPGKEVLLLAGGLWSSDGRPSLLLVFLAYIPLMIVSVWGFFALGRAYSDDLAGGEGPDWLHRVVPAEKLEATQRVIARRGVTVAILGRVAALPPTILAAAAGTSSVDTRRYLAADMVGAVLGFAVTVGVGVGLGRAYERGGIWLTVAGIALLLVVINLFTRWLQAEEKKVVPEAT